MFVDFRNFIIEFLFLYCLFNIEINFVLVYVVFMVVKLVFFLLEEFYFFL